MTLLVESMDPDFDLSSRIYGSGWIWSFQSNLWIQICLLPTDICDTLVSIGMSQWESINRLELYDTLSMKIQFYYPPYGDPTEYIHTTQHSGTILHKKCCVQHFCSVHIYIHIFVYIKEAAKKIIIFLPPYPFPLELNSRRNFFSLKKVMFSLISTPPPLLMSQPIN